MSENQSFIFLYRGLVYPWKQIIYYDFDKTMDQNLLFSIIRQCEDRRANVRGIVCDMGNSKLLKQLKVYSEQKHFFMNPADDTRKVFIFLDTPHCFKNLRNHCLDSNLCVTKTNGNVITLTKNHFLELVSKDQNDFKHCPKLSLLHLECKGNERQRVKYAVQLFSDTVAKAFKFLFGKKYLELTEIISTIDAWFDVCNSRLKFHWKKMKCALGVHESEQIKSLKNMLELVKQMTFGKDKKSQRKKPFQTGIIVSINSTLDLYQALKNEGISYLLTSRLNQDGLENFFSQVRALGGNNSHPSTVETINRIRTLCLTKNVKSIVNNSVVEMQDDDEFLSVNLIDELDLDLPDNVYCKYQKNEIPELNVEARDYVAGYITHKLKLSASNDRKPNSWISLKGEGRLQEPNEKLKEIVAKCDNIFDQVLGKGLSDLKNPLEKLKTEILNQNPDFPPQIVTLFCKVKFYSRIKVLNVNLKLNRMKNSVRSLKQMGQFLN